MDYRELSRFVAWCGRERNVEGVTPIEVADYAQHIGLGGAESVQRLNPVKAFLGYWKDEGWIQNGLAAHLRIPRGRRNGSKRAGGSDNASSGGTMLSREGYDRLVAQVADLKLERSSVIEDIRQAMADKDFRENAPLDAAKERQGFIESSIRDLERILSNAIISSPMGSSSVTKIKVGAKVTLKDMSSGKEIRYTLVDSREADPGNGRISGVSPVGKALLNKETGDEVVISIPRGTLHYVVKKIEA